MGRRDDVFCSLLYWMAHNVQKPGVKIRWSPILKGVHGDGKTLAAAVLVRCDKTTSLLQPTRTFPIVADSPIGLCVVRSTSSKKSC